jgi:hypothetical protein
MIGTEAYSIKDYVAAYFIGRKSIRQHACGSERLMLIETYKRSYLDLKCRKVTLIIRLYSGELVTQTTLCFDKHYAHSKGAFTLQTASHGAAVIKHIELKWNIHTADGTVHCRSWPQIDIGLFRTASSVIFAG